MEWESDYRYEPNPLFEQFFCCLPFSKYKYPHLETGDKIILPPSVLHQIIDSHIKNPYFFKITSFNSDKISHCGVLEFDAEDGFVYMPEWMMKNLNLEEGGTVILSDATVSRGVFMKLQPHSTAFIELTNPKVVLEEGLRGFSCLSRGDTFMIRHNERDFYFDVLEVDPGNVISLIETDCGVDFAQPLDYKEPEREVQGMREKVEAGEKKKKVDCRGEEEGGGGKVFRPFTGRARRLDGEGEAAAAMVVAESDGGSAVVGGRRRVAVEEGRKSERDGGKEEGGEKFKPFTGRSHVLGGL